ncbi:MAG: hypothetical protein K1X72_06535 [Pyrinomonadaceae bacterium]|nr:hypothetical protein [Pyrinomonadaceae bacterium]
MAIERGRAWRRFVNQLNKGNGMGSKEIWKPEKNWKMIYFRSEKLQRAKKLCFEYPRKNYRQLIETELDFNG